MVRIFLLFLLCQISCSVFACEVIDDTSHAVKLSHPAHRIISLAPDLTETLFAIGAGSQIIGVIQGSDYPEAAQPIQSVGRYNSVDIESIIALHPDLIVAWSDSRFISALKKLNIPVYLSHAEHITDIPKTMTRLGCLTGTTKTADLTALQFMQHYHQLQHKYARVKTLSVFYQVWNQPLMTVSQASWINDVIVLCGGRNIFSGLKGAAPEVNLEAVIAADPDVILGEGVESWMKWSQMAAVKNNKVFWVNPDHIERAGPRILDGMELICKKLASS